MTLDKRRMMIVGMCALIITGIPIALGINKLYWQQQMNPATFHFHYEECQAFTSTNWDDYRSKISSLDLLKGMTMLTITKNTVLDPLLIKCSFTSTAQGTGLTASGQYYKSQWIGSQQITEASGSSFVIPTNGESIALEMNKIMWADWAIAGEEAWALEITFTVDTSGIQEAEENPTGDYTYTVDLSVGTE